ncbi:MAG: nucleotidyltransferase family protein [bacterium]
MALSAIAIAILAAGRGSRFGSAKLLAPLRGTPMLLRAVESARASGASSVLVVVDALQDELWGVLPADVTLVLNPRAAEGIASSLRAALAHLSANPQVGACCIGLGDQPLVGADAYRRLAAAHAAGAALAVATYGGERRNPALLGRELWRAAMQLRGDQGARQLFATQPVIDVACDDTGDPFDVDTPADLAEIEKRCSSKTSFA